MVYNQSVMKRQFGSFLIRWALNSVSLWVAVKLFGTGYEETPEGLVTFLLAGLIFSLVNTVLRPIIVILSLPALLMTLGLFMFVVNGILVYIAIAMSPGFNMTFFYAILTGALISLLNYIVSNIVDLKYVRPREDN